MLVTMLWPLLLWGLIGADVAEAQASAPVVDAVEISGLVRVDKEAVLSRLSQKAQTPLNMAAITQDLKTLWATDLFQDVRLTEKKATGQVADRQSHIILHVALVEKPTVAAIHFLGVQALALEDIKNAADIKTSTILNVDKLKKAAQRIKEAYLEKGYFLAEVNFKIKPLPSSKAEVAVDFWITEHERILVKKITFIGNKALKDNQLLAVMQTQVGSELSFLLPWGTFKEEFLQNDLIRLQALYYDHGFVSVKIGEVLPQISPDRKYIYLTISVDEGMQYHIGNLSFSGEAELKDDYNRLVIDEALLHRKLSVHRGEVFSRTKLIRDVQHLTDLYKDYGYAYANVAPNTKLQVDQRQIALDFEIERGERVTIERIEVSGNNRTRDKVIRRELVIEEGKRYSARALEQSRARVFALGFFETVNIATHPGSQSDFLDVVVEVKEKSTGTFQIGAGISSVESFIANAQISQNNFLGNGQVLSFSMQLSLGEYSRQMATFQFVEPYFLDTRWMLGLNAYLNQRLYPDFQRNARGVAPNFGYPFGNHIRLNWGYTFEYVEINQKNALYDSVFYNLNRSGRVSALNASVSFDSRDNRLFPTQGNFDELRLDYSSPYLGASELMSFERLEADIRYFYPLVFGLVFRLNFQVGYVLGGKLGLPVSERYFPGGIYSVRGFSPRALGPTIRLAADVSEPGVATREFVIGGNKQVILNLEIEYPIIRQAGLKGVIFIDAGNAYNDDENFFYFATPISRRAPGWVIGTSRQIQPPLGLFYACGFGFRWQSPIGPLRFEWGIPLIKHDLLAPPILFEFTIGNFF